MKISIFWLSLSIAMLVLTYFANLKVDHGISLWVFSTLALLLLRSIPYGRVSWFYLYMVVFFFLGCWLKVVIHHIFDYPFIEPTGYFDGSEALWQLYYVTTSLLMMSFILSKLVQAQFDRKRSGSPKWQFVGRPVSRKIWLGLMGISSVFYAVNNIAAINVTGVHPIVILPFSLNAPIAFMALIGVAIVVSTFLAKDFSLKQRLDTMSTLALLVISGIASVSMASRAAIFMQAAPMLIAAAYLQATSGKQSVSLRPFFLFGVFFIVVLVVVAIYRINVYAGGGLNGEMLMFSAMENVMLVIDRWVGAEQILVGISEPTHSIGLFLSLLQEDPTTGVRAIYQSIAGTKYEVLEKLTFLTLPGYFGVLSLSGSLLVVFFGLFFITGIGMMYESLFLRRMFYSQTICISVTSAALANSFTQLSFPRLIIPFVIQLTLLVVALHYFLKPQISRSS